MAGDTSGAAGAEGLDGVDFVRERFVDAGEVRLQVAECGDPASDRLALCLHGFPECWYSWRHQMPLLARLGYRVQAPNLRGYGHSDRPQGIGSYAIEKLMGDVAGLIDAAGARQTLLLGHDWGGVIAWAFALRELRPLSGLAIFNLPHPACFAEAARGFAQLRRSWYVLFFQLPWLPERLMRPRQLAGIFRRTAVHPERFGPEVEEVYRRYAAQPGAATAMLNYYRAIVRGGGARRQAALGYPEITVPTLLIWGEQDVALTLESTYGTDRYVRDLTLRHLPDASHWVQQDAPEQVNAMLEAWLTGAPVPGGARPEAFLRRARSG